MADPIFKQLDDIITASSTDPPGVQAGLARDGPGIPRGSGRDEPTDNPSSDLDLGQLQAFDDLVRSHALTLQADFEKAQNDPSLQQNPHLLGELKQQLDDTRANLAVVDHALSCLSNASIDKRLRRDMLRRINGLMPQLIQTENVGFNAARGIEVAAAASGVARREAEEDTVERTAKEHKPESTIGKTIANLLGGSKHESEATTAVILRYPTWDDCVRHPLLALDERRARFVGWAGEQWTAYGTPTVTFFTVSVPTFVTVTLPEKAQALGRTVKENVIGVAQIVASAATTYMINPVVGATNAYVIQPVAGAYRATRQGLSDAYHWVMGDAPPPAKPSPIKIVSAKPMLKPTASATPPPSVHGKLQTKPPLGTLEALLSAISIPDIHLPWEHTEGPNGIAQAPGGWNFPELLSIA